MSDIKLSDKTSSASASTNMDKKSSRSDAGKLDARCTLKLGYEPVLNFGDKLNPWVWSRLLGVQLDVSSEQCTPHLLNGKVNIASIGSYLSEHFLSRFNNDKRLVVAGTGAGYGFVENSHTLGQGFPYKSTLDCKLPNGSARQRFTSSHRFYWVRGPITARLLNLDPKVVVADAAYLIRQLKDEVKEVTKSDIVNQVGFMPHTGTVNYTTHCEVARKIGMHVVSPHDDIIPVLRAIASCKLFVTEALHGAILADALRVPWIAVRTSPRILKLKWLDHCAAIGLKYQPITIRSRWLPREVARTQANYFKKVLYAGRAAAQWLAVSDDQVAEDLLYASMAAPRLSSDSIIQGIDERISGLVGRLQGDIVCDSFFD